MATWKPLQALLTDVDDQVTLSWGELDDLVGGLPPSAYQYQAFWSGDRSGWKGFRTTNVRVNHSVTFVRASSLGRVSRAAPRPAAARRASDVDLVLIGCVKSKLDHPAPAKDLYVSALFRKERPYAESSGKPWFILSAKYGLVPPDEVIEPYDMYLKTMPAAYRARWGRTVVSQLEAAFGPVAGMTIEIHASADYVGPLSSLLSSQGARVVTPLVGLTMGSRLAWYDGVAAVGEAQHNDAGAAAPQDTAPAPEWSGVVERLRRMDEAMSPTDFVAAGGEGLRHPGMYSWWVDPAGATTLTDGLGHRVEPGLIYAGLAGATRSRSGRKSGNTLWGRINGMHLGGRHELSTFRLSLGSVLAARFGWPRIDEQALTAWMYVHLKVVAVPVADADTLDDLETQVLRELDPPLNLMKLPRTPLRQRLSELRSQYGKHPS